MIVRDSAGTAATGKALVRFVQLSPDAPAVDFALVDNNTPLVANQAFKTATNFTEVTAGTYSLAIKTAGSNDALISVSNTELRSEGIYTVLVRGFVDPPSGNTNNLNVQIIRNE